MLNALPGFRERALEILDSLVALRHDLHAHPELAFQEHRTAGRIVERLGAVPNLKVRGGVGGTGVVAVLNDGRDGPCLALRADMDALPIQEAVDRPYASTVSGVMHACGHDGHVACLVGAAMLLSKCAADVPGRVKFIFQPAEEDGGGASRMIEQGALDNPKVDAIWGLHGWTELPLGFVGVAPGPVMAGTRSFDMTFRGKGGHAAYPHKGSDVIVAASRFVTDLQALRTRRVDPVEPAVVSICQVQAGRTYNVLPEVCHVKGTIRALNTATLDSLWDQVRYLAQTIATSLDAEASSELADAYPPVVNHAGCTALVEAVGRSLLGDSQVVRTPPTMGGEDFAYYGQRIPAAFYRLGLRPIGSVSYPPIHNPCYDFNDDAIPNGVAMHCGLAVRFLENPPAILCG